MVADLPTSNQRLAIEIQGAVQGVGFRPFVYRLATELGLAGWIINNSRGVFIEVEGEQTALNSFLARLSTEPPPRAIIHTLHTDQRLPLQGYERFEIRHSDEQGQKTVLVLPDIATCPDCLTEILTPDDRRCGYPFTNCTNCGPRFSIIQALPYDRPNTTMHHFVMCPTCQNEYTDPLDRRFHAQPNACPICGPQLELHWTADYSFPPPTVVPGKKPASEIEEVVRALRNGNIVAVKGLGGFHLMVDAANVQAVARLRQRKHRFDKPLAVMAANLKQVESLVEVSELAASVLTSAEAPIVLLKKRIDAPVAENVAPAYHNLGVMLPYTPLHHLLLDAFGSPLVATSGNLSDEPICTDNAEAQTRLGHIADGFLLHNRAIERHVDDSVSWLVEDAPRLLRRARGYAPLPVLLRTESPTVLAVGAHLKNTVALSVGRQAFISQHIGDLETAESMAAFERVIEDFLRLYEATPVALAHDMHPDYLSTLWAKSQLQTSGSQELQSTPPIELIGVQHHHAHLAACLADNNRLKPALGIIWDGTGYGTDGTIWGGEFLRGDAANFERVAHFRPFRLPGGDAAVKEPRRVALALLWQLFGDNVLNWEGLVPIRHFSAAERRLLGQMLQKNLNSPLTTSAGRLFDGIAALIGLHQTVTFEGQAAMALEFAVDTAVRNAYQLPMVEPANHQEDTSQNFGIQPIVLDWAPLVEAVLADIRAGETPGVMAARFHNALVEAMVAIALAVGEPAVALSGGCFQNRLLTEQAALRLRKAGFEVLLHHQVPPNDGGISLGQIAVAASRLLNF